MTIVIFMGGALVGACALIIFLTLYFGDKR